MLKQRHIEEELKRIRRLSRRNIDLVSEADRILKKEVFSGKNILDHLALYKDLAYKLEEEELPADGIFRLSEIQRTAIVCRLKFLEGKYYKPELPYEAGLKLERLNMLFRKEIREYSLLSTPEGFRGKGDNPGSLLFVRTDYDNYYLVHAWGRSLPWYRQLIFWPLRRFENLVLTVLVLTLILTLLLPTRLITLDRQADYWSGYRAAAFFHLLIFNFGVTVYFTFAFARNFTGTVWDRHKDFG